MKKTTKRVLAFLLASTFVFSAMTAGVYAIASYLNPNFGGSSDTSYMSVNSVDDFIDLIGTQVISLPMLSNQKNKMLLMK